MNLTFKEKIHYPRTFHVTGHHPWHAMSSDVVLYMVSSCHWFPKLSGVNSHNLLPPYGLMGVKLDGSLPGSRFWSPKLTFPVFTSPPWNFQDGPISHTIDPSHMMWGIKIDASKNAVQWCPQNRMKLQPWKFHFTSKILPQTMDRLYITGALEK